MSGLAQLASNERPLVFDGKHIHKKAFVRKGIAGPKHDALLARVLETNLSKAQGQSIADRIV